MYVISQDAHLLLKKWANKRGFKIPFSADWTTTRLATYLRLMFPAVEVVSAEELKVGMIKLVRNFGLTPVSIDRVYYEGGLHLDVTRGVDSNGDDAGLTVRPGHKSIAGQLRALTRSLHGQSEVILVDDVIFSGGIVHLIEQMKAVGVNTVAVIAGIAIREGITVLEQSGVDVRSVRIFQSVVDEICERDFLPGTPLCGRTVVKSGKVGAPYILPFGRPCEWASIPPVWEREFSKSCLNLAADVFCQIGEASGRSVFVKDLDRCPLGIDVNDQRSFGVLHRAMAANL